MTTEILYHHDHDDYCYRVYEDGLWIASAHTNHHADVVLTDRALLRTWVNVMERISAPHACPGCGDLTGADLCPACSEDMLTDLPLDVEFAPFGW